MPAPLSPEGKGHQAAPLSCPKPQGARQDRAPPSASASWGKERLGKWLAGLRAAAERAQPPPSPLLPAITK